METWQLEFIDSTSGKDEAIPSGVGDVLGSGVGEKNKKNKDKNLKDKKTFAGEFTKKIEDDTIKDVLISPLNTITGGFASPIYRTAKRLASGAAVGATLGAFGATLAIMAVQKGLEHLQNRVKEVEEEVSKLNNTDNVLIRAGAVSKATYYSRNFLGIKKTTDRS